jgi:aspartyl-tRNA(Asn)/glutamyl-tRNA(Gln) amidotransferase subunit C
VSLPTSRRPLALVPPADVVAIDPNTVRRVASLARLQFTPSEEEQLAADLEKIVGYVRVLEELELPAEAPALIVPAPLREDRVTNAPRAEDFLRGAPDRQGHHLRVPAVMKDKG